MSIKRGLDKEDVVHTHNGIPLSHEKKERSAVCNNVDRPRADQTEVRRSGKDNVIRHHLWNLKYDIYVQNK